MNIKVGELTSQIRSITKSLKSDNLYITDRLIWSLIKSNATTLLYQEDSKMKIMRMSFLFTPITVELVEVDRVEADCIGISSDCTIKRTKYKLPKIFSGYWGFLIRSVTTVDGEEELLLTDARTYTRKTTSPDFKYNKAKYFWFKDGYLYFPDNEWDAIKVDAAFEEGLDNCGKEDICISAQDMEVYIPQYILKATRPLVLADLALLYQIPPDQNNDKQNISR